MPSKPLPGVIETAETLDLPSNEFRQEMCNLVDRDPLVLLLRATKRGQQCIVLIDLLLTAAVVGVANPDAGSGRRSGGRSRGLLVALNSRNFLIMTEYFLVTGVHARTDDGDGVVAGDRHCTGNDLSSGSRDAIFVRWIEKPTIDARHDLMRLPARRSRLHARTFRTRSGPRSSGWKLAAARTGSAVLTTCVGGGSTTLSCEGSGSGFGNDAGAVPASTALA